MSYTGKFARLRPRVGSQDGFTLIELLVVILIIGILAAVAIPSFLSQTTKARDSNVQSALSTAQTTEAAYRTSNGGYATGLTSSQTGSSNPLIAIEPALSSAWSKYQLSVTASTGGYTVSGVDGANPAVTFSLAYNGNNGQLTKTCSPNSTGACNASGSW